MKLSLLSLPRETSFVLRGETIGLKYNAALLTQDYIDRYDEYLASLSDESKKPSQRMGGLLSNCLQRVVWIDLQGEDGKDLAPAEVLPLLTWDELQAIEAAIGADIEKRQNPTLETAPDSSSG